MVQRSVLLFLLLTVGCPGIIFSAEEHPGGAMPDQSVAADSQDQPALRKVGVDTNGDGQVDRLEYYDGETLSRVENDTDFDGKIDEWQELKDGKLQKAVLGANGFRPPDKWVMY